jgi:hypothetical protein
MPGALLHRNKRAQQSCLQKTQSINGLLTVFNS